MITFLAFCVNNSTKNFLDTQFKAVKIIKYKEKTSCVALIVQCWWWKVVIRHFLNNFIIHTINLFPWNSFTGRNNCTIFVLFSLWLSPKSFQSKQKWIKNEKIKKLSTLHSRRWLCNDWAQKSEKPAIYRSYETSTSATRERVNTQFSVMFFTSCGFSHFQRLPVEEINNLARCSQRSTSSSTSECWEELSSRFVLTRDENSREYIHLSIRNRFMLVGRLLDGDCEWYYHTGAIWYEQNSNVNKEQEYEDQNRANFTTETLRWNDKSNWYEQDVDFHHVSSRIIKISQTNVTDDVES